MFFLCSECRPAYYAHSISEVEEHENSTGHEFEDDSPDWTI